jgi:dihydroorotate dehydrogenase electron transfer subunit
MCITEVVRNDALCREHVRLELRAVGFPSSEPGQFVEIRCATPEAGPDVGAVTPQMAPLPATDFEYSEAGVLLRRPFSLADHWTADDGTPHLAIISRAIGRGTRWLEQLRPGQTLDITGPLGRGFHVPAAPRPLLLVGGGVGIPPLLYLARALHAQRRTDVTCVFGAVTAELVPLEQFTPPATDGTATPCVRLPGGANYGTIVTTDDGSTGLRGRVTRGLEAWHAQRGSSPATPLVFACGPEPMLRAVAQQTRAWGWDAQLCVERLMGCGLGTCLSCVVKVRDAADGPTRWALSCTEGPVFDRDVLVDMAD